jgi:hypothetical protein
MKLFLNINPERSRSDLSLMRSTLESWKFESRLAVEFPTTRASDNGVLYPTSTIAR